MSEPKHETFHPMPNRKKAICRSCTAPIFWLKMLSGNAAPLDYEPNATKGNIRAMENGRGQVLVDEELNEAREFGEPLFLSHFASCANAASHRKQKRA